MDTQLQSDDFRGRLRQAIREAGMTQGALARTLGVRDATISDWFNRGTMPSGNIMLQLPELLQCDGHWLLTGQPRSPSPASEISTSERARVAALIEAALNALHGSSERQHA